MGTGATRWNNRNRATLAAILVVSMLLVAARCRETPIGAITDDAYYIEMAQSLANGLGPVLNLGPGARAVDPEVFPAGFPLLLAPFAHLVNGSWGLLRAVPIAAALLLLPLCLWLPGAAAGLRLRLAATAAVMFNPWVVAWSGRILSDVPYTALSLATMLLFLSADAPDQTRARRRFLAGGVLLLAAGAVGVRTVGWTTVLAMAAVLLGQRRWKHALGLVVGVAVLQFPLNGGHLLTPGYRHQMQPHNLIQPWLQILAYVREVAVIMVPGFGGTVADLASRHGPAWFYPGLSLAVGALLLGLVGRALYGRRHEPRAQLMAATLVLTGLVLANFQGYPSGVQTRLLIPVLPILTAYGLLGARDLLPGRGPWLLLVVMLSASLGHNTWRLIRPLGTTVAADGSGLVDPAQGASWVTANTARDAVFMVEEPMPRHLHFQRDMVRFPDVLNARSVARAAAEFDVDYLFAGPSVHHQPNRLNDKGQAMLELLQSQPARYSLAWSDESRSLYFFRRLP